MNIIKLIVFDVDGTLTNGGITYHSDGSESKTFSSKDGLILKELYKLEISTLFLTARDSKVVEDRGRYLKITDILQNVSEKKSVLLEYADHKGISAESIAYIGDDLNDYAAMMVCGFKACPADASSEIREISDYVSKYNGGHGAVRDICEYILRRQNQYKEFLALFGCKDTVLK